MAVQNGDGAGALEFLDWAGRKGEMNPGTARAYGAAFRKLLEVEPTLASSDLRTFDVENLLTRFENLHRTDFTASSLATYKSRFRQTVGMYLAWLNNDPGWASAGKTPSQQRASNTVRARAASRRNPSPSMSPAEDLSAENAASELESRELSTLVNYTMPLRPGLFVRLALPADLQIADAKRISNFITSLAFEDSGDRVDS